MGIRAKERYDVIDTVSLKNILEFTSEPYQNHHEKHLPVLMLNPLKFLLCTAMLPHHSLFKISNCSQFLTEQLRQSISF